MLSQGSSARPQKNRSGSGTSIATARSNARGRDPGASPGLTSSLSCPRPNPSGDARGRRIHAQRRTANTPEPPSPDLESGWVNSPRGFESRILRHASDAGPDLRALAACRSPWSYSAFHRSDDRSEDRSEDRDRPRSTAALVPGRGEALSAHVADRASGLLQGDGKHQAGFPGTDHREGQLRSHASTACGDRGRYCTSSLQTSSRPGPPEAVAFVVEGQPRSHPSTASGDRGRYFVSSLQTSV